ncbi:Protein F28C6.4 a [Aphelenchoides avenae]|nr:Protein F28C6.4 a [Aphelenchus avenae]
MRHGWFLAGLLQVAAVAFFAFGFFPAKSSLGVSNGIDQADSQGPSAERCPSENNMPLKNLVLVVIDALRDEFFFSPASGNGSMPRTRNMVRSSSARAFRAHVQSPTVTMPRIKAIVSGTVPTYMDVLMNLASTEYNEDNVLRRAKDADKRLVFYGDDTWLKMFPSGIFEERSEGTTSFFVIDYTIVDDNVTRHLDKELSLNGIEQWDVTILHYLGLDHIGHSLGGTHPQLNVKLDEMDRIIERIVSSLRAVRKQEEFAVIVLGDHGMTRDGGHGGTSPEETHVPVVVITGRSGTTNFSAPDQNLDLSAAEIEQVDVVPTLSSLLGIPIPSGSMGVSFLQHLKGRREAIRSLRQNSYQFRALLLRSGYAGSAVVEGLERCLAETSSYCSMADAAAQDATAHCHSALKAAQEYRMHSATLLAASEVTFEGGTIFALAALQPLSFFASSLVEEEHDVWYFLLSTFLTIAAAKCLRSDRHNKASKRAVVNVIAAAILHRLCRSFSDGRRRRWTILDGETGDVKPRTLDWDWTFLPPYLSIVPFVLYCVLRITFRRESLRVKDYLAFIAFTAVLLFKFTSFGSTTAVFATLFLLFGTKNYAIALSMWTFFVIKPVHYWLVLFCYLVGRSLCRISVGSRCDLSAFVYAAIASAVFYAGNSNSISTVDIAAGYTGLASYQPLLVTAQALLNIYASSVAVFTGW